MSGANPARGEAALDLDGVSYRLRPSFAALVAAEDELGPLFGVVERASAGQLRLAEVAALFWHCLEPAGSDRASFAEALAQAGLVRLTPTLKVLLGQILQGR